MHRLALLFVTTGLLALMVSCETTTFPNFSHWDSIPSIARFPANKAPAVIHRSSRGLETDTAYRRRAQQSRQRPDIAWGAYHFCTGASVSSQLKKALDRVGYQSGAANRTLMVFDFERNVKSRRDYMRVGSLAELIRRFHSRTGVYPVLYVNPSWFNRRLATDRHTAADLRAIRKCPLWTSAYRSKPTKVNGMPSWTMWQYAGDSNLPSYGDRGNVLIYPRGIPGVGSKLEMNAFRGNVQALYTFWARHSIPTRY